MMSIPVLVVLGIIVLFAFFGYKKGLIKTAYSLFAVIIALVLTIALAPKATAFVKGNEKIYNKIKSSIAESVDKTIEAKKALGGDETVVDVDGLGLPKSVKDMVKEKKDATVDVVKTQITDKLTEMVIQAVGFIGVFVLISIALLILASLLNLISKLPGLNTLNKWGGLAVGLCEGLLIVWIFFILITAFAATDVGNKIFSEINSNPITSYIYNNNLILKWMKL